MKKRLLFLLLAALATLPLYAYDFEVDGIYYYKRSNSTCQVTNRSYYGGGSYSDNIVIPESVTYNGTEYTVTSIGERAFFDCSSLTSVTIGNSVTEIGNYTFDGCSSLTSITIPNSVTSIGNYAFNNCTGLTELIIEDGDQTLTLGYNSYSGYSTGKGLFYDCPVDTLYLGRNVSYNTEQKYGYSPFFSKKSLKSINIGNSVSKIGSSAFYGCSNLTTITIPNSVTTIGNDAFTGCSSLTFITIPNSLTEISASAFCGCSSLTSITIPNSVTTIGDGAFYGCSGLTSITISNSVNSIYGDAFSGCSGLTSVNIYDLEAWCKISFSSESSNPLRYAHHLFLNGEEIKNLQIPSTISSIKQRSFYGFSGLTSVTIPNSVTTIGNEAFYGCSGLTSVTIPNSVTTIGNEAFNKCTSLTELIIEDGDQTLTLGYNSSYKGLFYDCPLDTLYLGRNLSYNFSPFYDIESLKTVTIGNLVTIIDSSTFKGCSGLTNLTFNATSCTFCGSNTDPAFPSTIETLTFGDSVKIIPSYAFYGCSSLIDVTIPNSVTSIGNSTFAGCSGLTDLIFNAENCTSCGSNNELAFPSTIKKLTFGSNVKTIPGCTFYGCSGLTEITIPNSVNFIGSSAFSGCAGITKVNISDIGAWCDINFASDDSNPLSLAHHIFLNDQEITALEIPTSISEIKNYAFNGCTELTSLIIPNSVSSIGSGAFGGCVNITDILSQAVTPPSINGDSFANETYQKALVVIPSGTLKSYQTAWPGFHFINGEPVSETIVLDQPGTLMTKIKISEVNNIASLKLSGKINGTDLLTLNKTINLQHLDLSDATIVSGGMNYYEEDNVKYGTTDNTLGNYWAYALDVLQEVKLPNNLTTIADNAFKNKYALKSLRIPGSVTSIGNGAFDGCNSLSNLAFEDGDKPLSVSAEFSSCPIEILYLGRNINTPLLADKETLKSVTIGPKVTDIASSAFNGCNSLSKVTITDLEAWCRINFGNATSNPLSIAHHLFLNDEEIFNLEIPNSITSIKNYAFNGGSNFASVTIPNSITSIGNCVFNGCRNLSELIIEDGGKILSLGYNTENSTNGKGLFYGCPLEILYLGRNINFGQSSPFYNNKSLKSVTIGNSVTTIGSRTFNGCSSLTELIIEDGDQTLTLGYNDTFGAGGSTTITGKGLFSDCPLETLYLGRNLSYNAKQDYGYSPFYNLKSLKSVSIGQSVTEIGENALSGCSGLTRVKITDLAAWCNIEFASASANPLYYAHHLYLNDAEVTDLIIPNSITALKDYVFRGGSNFTSVTIPISVTSIGGSAFSGCSSLNSITIPNSITSIGSSAFSGCSGMTSITIPNSVTKIGSSAFYGCSGLTSITIPNSITSIGSSAFQGCNSLTSITIPNSVTNISSSTFSGCSSLTSVFLPNSITEIGSKAFNGCNSLTAVTIGNSVTQIGDEAFYNCSSLTSITIPNSVTKIGKYAFNGCGGLTELIIEDDNQPLTLGYNYEANLYGPYYSYTGKGLFYDCPLDTLYLGRNLSYNAEQKYGYSPFYNLKSLKSVSIGQSVSQISNYAFDGCDGLTRVNISDLEAWCNITFASADANPLSIAHHLYLNDEEVINLEIPNSVTDLKKYTFNGGINFVSVSIPASVTEISNSSFSGCNNITKVNISDVAAWCNINFASVGANPLSIAHHLYLNDEEVSDLQIPNSITKINDYAFYGTYSLNSVFIPKSVTELGEKAFSGCTALAQVSFEDLKGTQIVETPKETTFPDWTSTNHSNSSTSEKVYTFAAETGSVLSFNYSVDSEANYDKFIAKINGSQVLSESGKKSGTYTKEFTAAENVTLTLQYSKDSSDSSGQDCVSVTDIKVVSGNSNDGRLYLPADLFAECPIETLYLGRNFSYGSSPFSGNSALKTLTFGNYVTTIDSYAFSDCSGLTKVILPAMITDLKDGIFEDCSALESVTIPGGVRYIRSGAFKGCSAMESVNMINPIPAVIDEDSFDFTATLNVPQESLMYYWIHPLWSKFSDLQTWNVGSDVDFVSENGNSTTFHITSEESATVEVTAATLMSRASGELEIPETVTFNGKAYTVAGIANNAFQNMAFESIELPKSIAYVGLNAFSGCSALRTLTVNATLPPSAARESFDNEVFTNATLTVPEEASEAYATDEVWKLFSNKDIVDIEEFDAAAEDAEMEVYDMRGVKVGDSLKGLPHGVYIIRQGSRTTKYAI